MLPRKGFDKLNHLAGYVSVSGPASPNQFDSTLAFTRAPNKLAYAYWQSCCGEHPMPSRTDLNPIAMKQFTSHIGLVEVREDRKGAYYIRRAGSQWENVYGAMTGKYLSEFLPPAVAQTWIEAFDHVRFSKAPVRLTARVDFKEKTWLSIEMLIAPLGERESVTMLLTSFVSWSRTALY